MVSRPLSDNAVSMLSDDAFGFATYVEELQTLVGAARDLPLTVGVFGTWGSGKTSFLKMWENVLTDDGSSRTLWFNPWKYDQKVEVWAALIQSLLAELRDSDRPSVAERVRRLAKTAAWLAVRGGFTFAGSLATGGVLDAGTLDHYLDELTHDDATYYREVNRFENDFADAVAEFVGPAGRLVVFVDDLDRCTPDAALNVLEALKLFVGDARCVFVLAMDYDLLASVAAMKFGAGAPVTGGGYLEKIVQLPFFLPEVAFPALRADVCGHAGALSDDNAFWDLVERAFGSNPRRVKRYLNVFTLAVSVLGRQTADQPLSRTQQLQLAKLLIIRSEHRQLYRALTRDATVWHRLETSRALPDPGDPDETIEIERERDAEIATLLRDPSLVRILACRQGAFHDHVTAPAAAEVQTMMRTIALTAGAPSEITLPELTSTEQAP